VLQNVEAAVFHHFMRSGRTSPALFGCVHRDRDEEADYVVKLKGGLDMGTGGLVFEAVAAELADYFGISHPEPAIVQINTELANLIATLEPERANLIRKSVGMNFATKQLKNLIVWPVDRSPSAGQSQAASEIFAFDALIQNPDRKFSNPNLGTVGDQIFVYDHELAFSFLLDIFLNSEPWMVSKQLFWSEHVFFNSLRRKPLDIGGFLGRLAELPEDFVDRLREQLPMEWDFNTLWKIKGHLNSLSANAEAFGEELMRRLA
jgi:hypothetical protein